MKVHICDPNYSKRKGFYHPYAEFNRQKKAIEKNGQFVKDGKFHKLAVRLEATLPRGIRAKDAFTTELLLETINEEKEVKHARHKQR